MSAHVTGLGLGLSNNWNTPPAVFEALGERFDLDVSAPIDGPLHVPTSRWFSSHALEQDWFGFVWMNPPFGGRNGIEPWLRKFFWHCNGVALVPDRTSAPWWQEYAPRCDLALHVNRKLKFLTPSPILGSRKNKHGVRVPVPSRFPGLYLGAQPAQGTTLLALGARGRQALLNASRAGLGSLWSTYSEAA
jgi:hypothetical protein